MNPSTPLIITHRVWRAAVPVHASGRKASAEQRAWDGGGDIAPRPGQLAADQRVQVATGGFWVSEKKWATSAVLQPVPRVFDGSPTPYLWLRLSDARVLVLRLSGVSLGDDTVLADVLAAVADDPGGYVCTFDLRGGRFAEVLYAVPVDPDGPAVGSFNPQPDADSARLTASLDADVLALLGWLEQDAIDGAVAGGTVASAPAFFASVRNYNRLASLPPDLRVRRMQALRRFPGLVCPLLLTAHRSPDWCGGKRHAQRQPDEDVELAIDQGRDLTGALCTHFGVSRALVRGPWGSRVWWAPDHAARVRWLRVVDALEANQRPTPAQFLPWVRALDALLRLLEWDSPQADPARSLWVNDVLRGAFRLGWGATWAAAQRHATDGPRALTDCRDFLVAVSHHIRIEDEQAATPSASGCARVPTGAYPSDQDLAETEPPAPHRLGRLAGAWLACHGLPSLLAASARWHRLRPSVDESAWPSGYALPAVLDLPDTQGGRGSPRPSCDRHAAVELLTPQALAQEGEAMHHCVASYWDVCLQGDRIVALQLATGERATAQYHAQVYDPAVADTRYALVQLRGVANRGVSRAMRAWAKYIRSRLNAPQRQAARWAALQARQQFNVTLRERQRQVAAWLDAVSQRQLLATLAWMARRPPVPDVVLDAPVAGYPYHDGPRVLEHLAVGQALTLVREPDNPHDPLAVRVDWQGRVLGYVPRMHNPAIARRLDAGEPLRAHITRVDTWADAWSPLQLAITSVGADKKQPPALDKRARQATKQIAMGMAFSGLRRPPEPARVVPAR